MNRTPLLIAGGAGLLLTGIAVGVWLGRPTTPVEPAATTEMVPAEAAAAVAPPRAEDAERVVICGPSVSRPQVADYGPLRAIPAYTDDSLCSVDVRGPDGALLVQEEIQMQIEAQYVDLDNDRTPEIVIVADSGGSAGVIMSHVLAQTPEPRLIDSFGPGCPATVVHAPGGERVLRTCDLSFYLSGEYCNACAPKPARYFRYANGQRTDVSTLFVAEYDKAIDIAAKQLEAPDLQAFLASRDFNDPAYTQSSSRFLVLRMAVDYVVSGRPDEARRTFEQMWPAWDREAIISDTLPRR